VIDVAVSFWEGSRAARRGQSQRLGVGRQFYIMNPFLFFIFFHTLPPPCLYIISLFYICIWNPFLFFIFIRTLAPPTITMHVVSQERGRWKYQTFVAPKSVHLLFFLVVRRCFSLVDFMKKLMTLVQQREIQRCDPPECTEPTPLRLCHPTTTGMMLFSTIVHYYH
jgi:hypothetical protein